MGHGFDEIVAAFFFCQTPDEQHHRFSGDIGIWAELIDIYTVVVVHQFVGGKPLFDQLVFEELGYGDEELGVSF